MVKIWIDSEKAKDEQLNDDIGLFMKDYIWTDCLCNLTQPKCEIRYKLKKGEHYKDCHRSWLNHDETMMYKDEDGLKVCVLHYMSCMFTAKEHLKLEDYCNERNITYKIFSVGYRTDCIRVILFEREDSCISHIPPINTDEQYFYNLGLNNQEG